LVKPIKAPVVSDRTIYAIYVIRAQRRTSYCPAVIKHIITYRGTIEATCYLQHQTFGDIVGGTGICYKVICITVTQRFPRGYQGIDTEIRTRVVNIFVNNSVKYIFQLVVEVAFFSGHRTITPYGIKEISADRGSGCRRSTSQDLSVAFLVAVVSV